MSVWRDDPGHMVTVQRVSTQTIVRGIQETFPQTHACLQLVFSVALQRVFSVLLSHNLSVWLFSLLCLVCLSQVLMCVFSVGVSNVCWCVFSVKCVFSVVC